MTVALPDAAVDVPSDDHLGRDRFAQSLAQLVIGAPDGSTLRIGVYGGWGSGKTSVLKLVAYHVRAAEGYVVWLLPWAFTSSRECYRSLILSIAKVLSIGASKPRLLFQAQSRVAGIREAVRGDFAAKVADSILGSSVDQQLGKWAEKETVKLLSEIRTNLKGKKLLVLVDDLDRLNPDEVPRVLLTLRELLDEPNIYYMLALSPSVVQVALGEAHPGWGNSLEFLEKVIELPRLLPQPTDEEWRRFLESLKGTLNSAVSNAAFDVAASYLPRNPRKAKLFVRYLASLSPLFERLNPKELDWLPFLLAQMLLLEFPEEAMSMVGTPKIIENIELHAFRLEDAADEKGPPPPEETVAPTNEQARKRFLLICGALRARTGLIRGMYSLRQMFTLHEAPPATTWGELERLLERVKDGGPSELDKWVNALGPTERRGRMQGLFQMLVRARENTLGAAAEANMEEQLLGELAVADQILQAVRHLALGDNAFASSDLVADHWFDLCSHCAQWSHFDDLGYYAGRRDAERVLLKEIADTLPEDTAADILGRIERSFDHSVRKKSAKFTSTIEEIKILLSHKLSGTVRRCFEEPEGIEQFWAQGGMSGLRYLLFDPRSLLHREGLTETMLEELLPSARMEPSVRRNFLTFLRMLTYGAFGKGSFSRGDSEALLRNVKLLSPLWRGATEAALNPRTTGSLRQDRTQLLKMGIPADVVPLPEWWQKLEETFFAKLEAGDQSEDDSAQVSADEVGDGPPE